MSQRRKVVAASLSSILLSEPLHSEIPAALTVRFNSPYRRGLSLSSQAILNLCLPFVSL
jgi:hypothetical protein